MPEVKVVSLLNPEAKKRMFEPAVIGRLTAQTDWVDARVQDGILAPVGAGSIRDAQICLCSWGAPRFTAEILDQMPQLRLIVYAAGTIKNNVTEAVWERGIAITSGAWAIGINVAETMLGMIITMMKNLFALAYSTREKGWQADPQPRAVAKDMIGTTVGVIGAGHVGRNLLKLLRNFAVDILLYDPMITPVAAEQLGARLVSLEQLMSASYVVALAAPGIPATRHMLDAGMLRLMKDGTAVVSAAAGSLIDEDALVQELRTGRIRACLDCTYPEPPAADHPLLKLPNVYLTQHVAGVTATGYLRLGRYAAEEIERFVSGREALNPVRREQLEFLA